jgi:hypothetical protein
MAAEPPAVDDSPDGEVRQGRWEGSRVFATADEAHEPFPGQRDGLSDGLLLLVGLQMSKADARVALDSGQEDLEAGGEII